MNHPSMVPCVSFYFSEINTRGWPYRRRDLLLPFNHSFAENWVKVTRI